MYSEEYNKQVQQARVCCSASCSNGIRTEIGLQVVTDDTALH